jgi:hypothetical protein
MAAAIAAGALGASAVVAGLVFWSRAADHSAQNTTICSIGCESAQWQPVDNDGKRDAKAAAILLVSGGVVAAAGAAAAVYLYRKGSRHAPEQPRLSGGLDLAPVAGGAKLSFVRRW